MIVQECQAFARQEGRSVILEKTPEHVHTAGRIRRLLPESRIIVVVRNPLDICAPLYSRFHDLDLAIERWLMDSKAALAVMQQESTLLVRHESLTRRPAETLSEARSFLGNMAIRHAQVSQPIRDDNGKWVDVLDPRQAAQVRDRTAGVAARLGYPSGAC